MLQSSNVAHKTPCCTIPNTFQGQLLVFLLRKGLLYFYLQEWQWCFSRHFERISCSLPSWWASSRRGTRFPVEEQGLFGAQLPAWSHTLMFLHSDQDWVKPGYNSFSGKGGEFLQPHRRLCCHKRRAGTTAEARDCRQRMGRRAPASGSGSFKHSPSYGCNLLFSTHISENLLNYSSAFLPV